MLLFLTKSKNQPLFSPIVNGSFSYKALENYVLFLNFAIEKGENL